MAESWLVALNTVRNCCAHHSRLWNKTLGTKPMIPRDDTAWHEPHEVGNHKMFGTLTVLSYMLETIAPATSWRSRLLDLMEERLPREEWRAMGFGDGRERHPLWSKWLVNEKVDESFNEESRQNEGRQDQTKGPGQQRCHAPSQLLLQPLARHARISFARFYTVEPHHAAETDRRP